MSEGGVSRPKRTSAASPSQLAGAAGPEDPARTADDDGDPRPPSAGAGEPLYFVDPDHREFFNSVESFVSTTSGRASGAANVLKMLDDVSASLTLLEMQVGGLRKAVNALYQATSELSKSDADVNKIVKKLLTLCAKRLPVFALLNGMRLAQSELKKAEAFFSRTGSIQARDQLEVARQRYEEACEAYQTAATEEAAAAAQASRPAEGHGDPAGDGPESSRITPAGGAAATEAAPAAPAPEPPPVSEELASRFEVLREARDLWVAADRGAEVCERAWPAVAQELKVLRKLIGNFLADSSKAAREKPEDSLGTGFASAAENKTNQLIAPLRRLDEYLSGMDEKGEDLPGPDPEESAALVQELRDDVFTFAERYGNWQLYPISPGDAVSRHGDNLKIVKSSGTSPRGALIERVLHPGYQKAGLSFSRKPRVLVRT
jgi:hypothetical protein